MDNNPLLLKSSVFGGFKKKDVLSYIFELNEATQDEKQKLAEQIEELIQSRDSFSARTADMEQRMAALQASLDDAMARLDGETRKNAELSELIETLRAEIARHENTISQQNAEIARQIELNADLTEKNRGFEEKRHQVELAASQIAELLGQAHEDAANVVERAKLEAEDIIKNAKASIEAHVEEANKSIDDAYKKFGEFRAEIESLHLTMLETTSAMNEEMRSLEEAVSDIEKLVPEKLIADSLPPSLPSLEYMEDAQSEEAETVSLNPPAVTAAATSPSVEEEAATMTKDILLRYGVRKDDSGFFRLASDQ